MGYPGLPKETITFLKGLAANNRKDWFEAHRPEYEAHWRDAGLNLIEELQPFCNGATPRLEAPPKVGGGLKRIHRDVRFSKDKTPYAPMLHVVLGLTGGDRHTGFHLVIHPDRIGFGAGQYGLDSGALERFRARAQDARHRARLTKAAEAAGTVGSVWDEPDLKRLPRGYETAEEWEHLLRRKSVILRGETKGLPGWLHTPRAVGEIERLAAAHLPLLDWLAD